MWHRGIGLVALLLSVGANADAATRTWTGSSSNLWSEPANWGGVAPAAGDDLVFPAGAPHLTSTNDLPAGVEFSSMSIAGVSTISGNAISLGAGGLTVSANAGIGLPIRLTGAQSWTASPTVQVTCSGALDLNGQTLTIRGGTFYMLYGAVGGSGAIQINSMVYFSNTSLTYTGPFTMIGPGSYVQMFRTSWASGINVPPRNTLGIFDLTSVAGVLTVASDGQVLSGAPYNGVASVGGLTLAPGAHFEERSYGVLSVTGAVDVTGAVFRSETNSGYPVPIGFQHVIIDNDGVDPVVGTFQGLAEGAEVVDVGDGRICSISYVAGSGNDIALTLLRAATPVTLVSSANPVTIGQGVTFTATASAGGGPYPVPTGTITFRDGSTDLATVAVDASGIATYTTAALTVGSHSVKATYNGDAAHAPWSRSLTQAIVLQPTATALSSSVNPSLFLNSVTFTATTTAASGAFPGTTTFRDVATTLATVSGNGSGVATFTTSALSMGTHAITASYDGDAVKASSTSGPLAQVVNPNFAIPMFDPRTLIALAAAVFTAALLALSRVPR